MSEKTKEIIDKRVVGSVTTGEVMTFDEIVKVLTNKKEKI